MRQLSFIALALPLFSLAQPTILQEHLPQAGQVFIGHNDYQGGSQFIPTPASADPQIWDYTTAFGNTSEEEIVFLPATDIPGAVNFPAATLGLNYVFGGSSFSIFYSNGPEGFKVEGFHNHEAGSHTTITTHEGDIHIPVPLTYGNSTTIDALEIEITIYETQEPATMHRIWTNRTMTADAYGTIHTPAWPDGVEVVRHRYETNSVVDSMFLDMSGSGNGPWEFQSVETYEDSEPAYNYLRAGQPTFVMEIAGDGSFAVYYESDITTSLQETTVRWETAQAFPNPATSMITIAPSSVDVQWIEVTSITGGITGKFAVQGAERIDISTEGWAAGTYLYRCLDAKGVPGDQGRFIVVR